MMEKGGGCGVGNGLDSGNGVGNGLDSRGRVDVVVDVVSMPALDVLAFQVLLLLKVTSRWSITSGIQQRSTTSSGTRTSNHHYYGHDQLIIGQQATRPWQTPTTVQ